MVCQSGRGGAWRISMQAAAGCEDGIARPTYSIYSSAWQFSGIKWLVMKVHQNVVKIEYWYVNLVIV